MTVNTTATGDYVRAARRFQRLTQRDLGRLANVSHITVCRIEKHSTNPNPSTRAVLAEALGYEPVELFPPTGEASPSQELRDLLEPERRGEL